MIKNYCPASSAFLAIFEGPSRKPMPQPKVSFFKLIKYCWHKTIYILFEIIAMVTWKSYFSDCLSFSWTLNKVDCPTRVAEKSYPSYPDCIQIEISSSNLMPKFTHFLSQNGQCRIVRLSCVKFSILTKIYCKLYKTIGCSLKELHAALFDAGKLFPVLDAASTSASKAFQVLIIIVINQKNWS